MTAAADALATPVARKRRRWLEPGGIPRRLLRHRSFVIGLCLFLVVVLAALLAPLIAPGLPQKRARFLI